jgi:hypothetical protein
MSIAAEHMGEAADRLRAAALIADPYLRADAIWEAVERINDAVEYLGAREAACCAEIARRLEEACDGSAEPPPGASLRSYACTLDGI